jgi:hypothetical protein
MFRSRLRVVTNSTVNETYSVEFNGTNSYMNLGSDSSIDNIFANGGTIVAWVRPHSDGGSDTGNIISKSKWKFYTYDQSGTDVKLAFEHDFTGDDGVWATTSSIPVNKWSLVGIAYDKGSVSNNPLFFMNKSSAGINEETAPTTGAGSGAETDASSTMYVGANSHRGAQSYDGDISEIAIYDRIITRSEFFEIYNNREPFNHLEGTLRGNLLTWLRMGDGIENGTGGTVYDGSAGGIDATAFNHTYVKTGVYY